MERAIQEVWALFKETDRKIEKSSLETDRKIQEVNKIVGNLTGKWSRFVEGLIAPGAIALFRERGIEVERIYQHVKVQKNGEGIEIDLLAVDQECVVPIEAKSTLGVDDVTEHVERMKAFKSTFILLTAKAKFFRLLKIPDIFR